jgi:hypothetical protein
MCGGEKAQSLGWPVRAAAPFKSVAVQDGARAGMELEKCRNL